MPTITPRIFIHLTYTSRAFEWLLIWHIFSKCLSAIQRKDIILELDTMCFGWRYLPSISSVCYHLSAALCHFSVDNLPRDLITCSCKNNRLRPFLDILTIKEHQPDPATAHAHVFTTDLGLINNKFIRCNLPCGLNHVIPQPSMFQEAL